MDEKNWQQADEATEFVCEEAVESSEAAQETKPAEKEKNTWQNTVLTYLHDLVFLLAGLVLVFLLLFRVVVVSGDSMMNTLVDGDYLLLLSNIFYQDPEYGDVIVARRSDFLNGDPIVKRVIATEGQWVDIRGGKVYVAESKEAVEAATEPLAEEYTWEPTIPKNEMVFPAQVPENCLFVMGDNRNDSTDSRNRILGFVDKREVLGKVLFLFLPGTDHGEVERDYGRIGVVD